MSINFQFLRDCVTALKEGNPTNFNMRNWAQPIGFIEENNWCGTPACVAGHWASRELAKRPLAERQKYGGWLFLAYIDRISSREFGLNQEQRAELFGTEGCGNAQTSAQAIAYLQRFIIRHGGSIEDPKPLVVAVVPDWTAIATRVQAVAYPTKEVV